MSNVAPKKRLGELLVEAGIIDDTQLKAALGHQRQWGVRLGQAVVDMKFATEQEVVKVLAKRFGFEVARLDQVEAYAHQQAVGLVPHDFAVKHNVFPLAADTSTLSVAMSDPSNLAVIDELRFRSGRRLKVSIGGDQEVAAAIQAAYPSPDGGVEAIALDIDDGSAPTESVMEPFGGGSSEDFDSFFGAEPAPAHGTAEDDPFSAGPAAAPVSVPVVQAGPLPAAAHAPFPAPVAPQHAPAAAPPTPAAPSSRAPVTQAVRAAPAARPAPAAPAAPAARPAAPATARPGPRPMIGDLELELPPREPQPRRAPPAAAPAPQPAASAARPARPAAPASPAPAARPRPAAPAAAPVQPPRPAAPEVEEELTPITGELELPDDGSAADLSPAERAVLAALAHLAAGGHADPETLKPTQAIAVLIRLLLKKGVITERELLDALRARDGR